MTTSNFLKIFLLLLSFSAIACKKDNKCVEVEEFVNEWLGREIFFPSNFQCNIKGKDTSSTPCEELLQKEFKVLIYIDSTGCSDCRLRLFYWKKIIEESDTLFGNRLGFMFFIQPKNIKELSFLLRKDDYALPVFIDTNNEINKINQFPEQQEYQAFLLNKNNRVLIVGNPVNNVNVWKLIKEQITELTKN
jgi:hypothetical protein